MYFPKLFDLAKQKRNEIYTEEILAYIDDYLGTLKEGAVFTDRNFNRGIGNIFITKMILDDLAAINIIERDEEEDNWEDDGEQSEDSYRLLIAPVKSEDLEYAKYLANKRKLDSFSIVYERTKRRRSGALTLIDVRGYSRNMKDPIMAPFMHRLISLLQELISNTLEPYFQNSYSAIQIKQNGDGWFLYFLDEREAFSFLETVISTCLQNDSISSLLKTLEASLKCYIHHTDEIEKIYKVDSMHFDMEGKDVILIHSLEKPVESILYNGIIPKESNFIAVTEGVFNKLENKEQIKLKRLSGQLESIKDFSGEKKIDISDLAVFFTNYG